VIAERAILGGEYTVAILGEQALPIIKIEPSTEFYDYEAKYLRDDTAYRCPCGLPESLRASACAPRPCMPSAFLVAAAGGGSTS
jgi:D-alanine-D-alanine ligase